MSKIYWLTGISGAGKTFLGDYLEEYCGFLHVDGDTLLVAKDEKSMQLASDLRKSFFEYIFLEKRAPDELWKPYFRALCEGVRAKQQEYPGRTRLAKQV